MTASALIGVRFLPTRIGVHANMRPKACQRLAACLTRISMSVCTRSNQPRSEQVLLVDHLDPAVFRTGPLVMSSEGVGAVVRSLATCA